MGKRGKIRVTRRVDGHKTSYLMVDKGKPGRTPEEDRWYEPSMETGWNKDLPEDTRRALMLKAHGGDYLASARALMALRNVTTDLPTKIAAQKDADYFYKIHNRRKAKPDYRQISKNMRRITPRQRPISPKSRPLS